MHTGFQCGTLRKGDHLENPDVNDRLILKWILDKWDEGHELDRSGSGQGQVAGSCECGNEPSGSIKCGEFVDWLRTSQLVRKDSAPWSQLVSQLVSLLQRSNSHIYYRPINRVRQHCFTYHRSTHLHRRAGTCCHCSLFLVPTAASFQASGK